MNLSIDNATLDLAQKACTRASSLKFSTMSDYLTHLIEQDCGQVEDLDEDTVRLIIDELMDFAISNRRELDKLFTMQELYTYCVKNEDEFLYPKWAVLTRSSRIELGRKFKAAVLKHAETVPKGEWYILQDGKNINNAAFYVVTRDRV